jgi:phosphonate transport system substrate-binding protein
MGVLMGDFDAGAVMEDVFYQHEGRGLRALAETPLISEHVFAASSAVDAQTLRRLRTLLYSLKETPGGREAMRAIRGPVTAMVPAQDADYDSLRKILLELEKTGMRL